jgi:hypothetical protein
LPDYEEREHSDCRHQKMEYKGASMSEALIDKLRELAKAIQVWDGETPAALLLFKAADKLERSSEIPVVDEEKLQEVITFALLNGGKIYSCLGEQAAAILVAMLPYLREPKREIVKDTPQSGYQTIPVAAKLPAPNQIVIVAGGVAQYRQGNWWTGMEEPLFQRRIQWKPTWWMPIPVFPSNEIEDGRS